MNNLNAIAKRGILVGLFVLLAGPSLLKAQTPDTLDPRVTNIAYWMEMAKRGLVEGNTPQESAYKEATYTSSDINSSAVLTTNSTDVPVTSNSNTTQSETSVFVHPTFNNTVLNSNNSTAYPYSQVYGADHFVSSDEGMTWNGSIQGVGGQNSGDPAAAIGLNGNYYVGFIGPNDGQRIARSTDGGQTWTQYQVTSTSGADKNHLWTDNNPTSPYRNNLYNAWTDLGGGSNYENIIFSHSTDTGISWSTPVDISQGITSNLDQGVNISTGPSGVVYTVWAIYDGPYYNGETAIGFAKSTDGGQSFASPKRIIDGIQGIRDDRTAENIRVNSYPVMAVDISGGPRNGNIYVVWTNIGDPNNNNSGSDIDVYMIRSTDGGNTWSSAIRINQDPVGNGNEQFFPWITCDPETGALSVIFYDDRNVPNTESETFAAVSYDGGNTWEDFKISDVSFTPYPITGEYFGDYIGISARGQKVYPMWTDNRQGQGRAMAYVSPFTTLPPDLVLQNQTRNAKRTYRAQNSITAQSYTVKSSGDVTLRAGNTITLEAGFTAKKGSKFYATVDPSLNQGSSTTTVATSTSNESTAEAVTKKTASESVTSMPAEFSLSPNYPNPFQSTTEVRFTLPEVTYVSLIVYDVMGREVTRLVDRSLQAGVHQAQFDAADLPAGVYLLRLTAGGLEQTQQMLVMK